MIDVFSQLIQLSPSGLLHTCTPVYSLITARSARGARRISGAELSALDHEHALRHGGDEVEVLFDEHDRELQALAQRRQVAAISSMIDGWMPSVARRATAPAAGRRAPRQRQQLLLAADNDPPARSSSGARRGETTSSGIERMRARFAVFTRPMRRLSRAVRPGNISRPCGT